MRTEIGITCVSQRKADIHFSAFSLFLFLSSKIKISVSPIKVVHAYRT